MIERLSGKSFRDLLAENVLDKLGMTRSVPGQDSTEPRYQPVLDQLAKPYKLDGAGRIVPFEYPSRMDAGPSGP